MMESEQMELITRYTMLRVSKLTATLLREMALVAQQCPDVSAHRALTDAAGAVERGAETWFATVMAAAKVKLQEAQHDHP